MKVTKIIDAHYKSGTSPKNGKPWTLIKIEAEGKEATGFGPVSVGDEVDLTYDEKYKNYSFKVLNPQEIPNNPQSSGADGMKLLQLVYENTQQILKLLEPKPQSINAQSLSEAWQQTTGQAPDNVVEDIGDEPMNVDDIPF